MQDEGDMAGALSDAGLCSSEQGQSLNITQRKAFLQVNGRQRGGTGFKGQLLEEVQLTLNKGCRLKKKHSFCLSKGYKGMWCNKLNGTRFHVPS